MRLPKNGGSVADFSNMTVGHAAIRAAEASEDNRGGLVSEFGPYDLVDLATERVALVPRDLSDEHVLYLVDGGTRLVVDDVLLREEWEELTSGPQA